MATISFESAVSKRYIAAAKKSEAALCCPIEYDKKFLEILPPEVIEKDYGCGDPSKHLRADETVLDLGSGTGKICFIAAQVVGKSGRVIGVDMTDDMLEVARRNAPLVAEKTGFSNVEFRKGRIQDLALDLDMFDSELRKISLTGLNGFLEAERLAQKLREENPLIKSQSIDVVVSNCVLNLVEPSLKASLFREIFRVLKPGGRAVISDIVSAREIPEALQNNPELWSGCISGALTESGFIEAFEKAGLRGIQILKRDPQPWQVVEGIEFRSITVQAWKLDGADTQCGGEFVYAGPFKEVVDEDGNRFIRGQKQRVDERVASRLVMEPLNSHFIAVNEGEKNSGGTTSNCCDTDKCC
jgi:ubiquinone/menaquinone biosynthesis C-methylase UbiE